MQVIRRGLIYLRPYRWLAGGAFVSTLVVTGLNLVAPQLFRRLIDDGIEARSWNEILLATSGLLGVAVLRGLFNFTNAYWSEMASQGIAYDLRNAIFRKLETLSFSYHDGNQTGQLMTRATSDVEGVRTFFARGVLQMISAGLMFLGSITILLVTDWRLALASLTIIPGIIWIFAKLFRYLVPLFDEVQANLGVLNNILQENIAGVRVVKAFAGEQREYGRYTQQNQVLYNKNVTVINTFSIGFPTVFLLSNIGTLIVVWFGGNRVISQALSLGDLIAFNSYLAYLLQPIFQLGVVSQMLARASASGKRIFEVLDAQNEIVEKPDAAVLPAGTPGRIVFENVHFQYMGGEEEVLNDVSFEIPPGQTVALIGSTGSGKSSIVNLIPRFYEPVQGRILIDGKDVRDVTLDSLRRRVAMVLQDIRLVRDTVADNIRYGMPEAPDREVERAARIAQAHDFITQLPQGYETAVGERGAGLSGGQRQRIAIARTLLMRPSILILDDATSAVDAETEAQFQKALGDMIKQNRVTTIIIAQRISTVRHADLILVIDQGRVAAQGTHEELMTESPIYAEIVHSQLEHDVA